MTTGFMTPFHGFCMALAGSVPGVSGGTVAFILGFYDHFIGALHDLFGRDGTARKTALHYLLKLGAGWVIGMGLCVSLLANLFSAHIYFMSSPTCCRRILLGVGLFLMFCEGYKLLFYYYVIGHGSFQWWVFPFQLCSIPMYLCVAANLPTAKPYAGRSTPFSAPITFWVASSPCWSPPASAMGTGR